MPSRPPFSPRLWTRLKKRPAMHVKSSLTRGWPRFEVAVGLKSFRRTMGCTERRPGVYASAGMCAAVRIYMKFSAYVGFLLVIFQQKLISVSS